MNTKSAIYKNSVGHLQASIAYGAVSAGCTGRTFKPEDLVIVTEDIQNNNDYVFAALSVASGNLHTESYQTVWPNWVPNNDKKVVVNQVKFITSIVMLPKKLIGPCTQTDIKLENRQQVIDYLLING